VRLEEELKQRKPFKDERSKLVVNTIYTGLWFKGMLLDVLKKFNINDQHYNILRILRGRYPEPALTMEIKEVLVNKRGDLTRQLEKLVKLGLIEREINPDCKTQIFSFITQKGLDTLDQIHEIHDYEDTYQTISEEEAKIVNEILDKLRG
jgi:DNA-binding MarR family transcriptional regulator